MTHEERFASLGLTRPPVPSPVANYVNAVRSGNFLFLSGKGPLVLRASRYVGGLHRSYAWRQAA